MPASFRIYGLFKVPLTEALKSKYIERDCPDFWMTEAGNKHAGDCGCYVFAIRAAKGFRPIYVGKATKNFKQECFASQKIADHYTPALLNLGKGTPVIFFVALERAQGRVNESAIGQVEKFLIQNAMKKNPDLSNIKGTKSERWSIVGVIRNGRGKVPKSAKLFKKAVGV